jgi:TorA maturation chaperone TorD
MRSRASLSTPQEGLREQFELQRDFLEHHLLAWVPSFRDKVSQGKKGGFYEIIANFTKRFIELDDSWLNQRLQKVNFAD